MLERELPDTTHWVQLQADPNFVPKFPADKQIEVPDLKPLLATCSLPGMYVDCYFEDWWNQGDHNCENYYRARLSGDKFTGVCSWARHIRSIHETNKITLDEIYALYSSLLTPEEISDRLNLTLLPLWCQDEVDHSKMPLEKAIALSHYHKANELWENAKRLFPWQIEVLIKVLTSQNAVFSPAYGSGKTYLMNTLKELHDAKP